MTNDNSRSTVVDYYDSFLTEQIKTGLNKRHRIILDNLRKAGLKRHHHVLEIGCGIGILSGEIARYARRGKVTGADISPESIAHASNHWKNRTNLNFVASDIRDLELNTLFDIILMPDVLEHIPTEIHEMVFLKLAKLLKPEGKLMIHIPSGTYNQYIIDFEPDNLQVTDYALSASDVVVPAEKAGLELLKYIQYSLHVAQGDYVWMEFHLQKKLTKITRQTGLFLYYSEFLSRLKHFMFRLP